MEGGRAWRAGVEGGRGGRAGVERGCGGRAGVEGGCGGRVWREGGRGGRVWREGEKREKRRWITVQEIQTRQSWQVLYCCICRMCHVYLTGRSVYCTVTTRDVQSTPLQYYPHPNKLSPPGAHRERARCDVARADRNAAPHGGCGRARRGVHSIPFSLHSFFFCYDCTNRRAYSGRGAGTVAYQLASLAVWLSHTWIAGPP